MITYGQVFSRLSPGVEWRFDGDPNEYENYSVIAGGSLPSKTACDTEKAKMVVEAQVAEVESARFAAFQREADPLFFGWQRGENTEQEWLDKVAEIRGRYPYPA